MISLLPRKVHYYIFVFAVFLLAAALPLSKYLMSLSQLILLGNWILEGDLVNKFRKFWNNKPAVVLASLLVLHFAGLFYSSDFQYALNDIRIKLPILAFPLIFSTSAPLSKKMTRFMLATFVAATLVATLASSLLLSGIFHNDLVDIRNISVFISHIRFSLLICVAIFILMDWIYREKNTRLRLLFGVIILWFVAFMFLLEAMTGLVALGITLFFLLMYWIFASRKKVWMLAALGLFLTGSIALAMVIKSIYDENRPKETFAPKNMVQYTSRGNPYCFYLKDPQTENGYYLWKYFNLDELEQAWNKRSTIGFNGMDLKGNEIRFTLVRFLASKGWRKDADAVDSLSEQEIKAIEHGIPNVNYQDVSSIKGRLHELVWEIQQYQRTQDPNGHSLTMRFVFWKTAMKIIAAHPLIGVGTGDVQQAFDRQYEADHTVLAKEFWFHSHNQYLTITVAFGVLGLILFFIVLFYPVRKLRMGKDFLYMTFFIITLISFLNEDTLETQAGVTFYVFFNTVFLFGNRNGELEYPEGKGIRSLLFDKYNN